MAFISSRLHIAWLPDEPSEPTNTLVLTSPKRYFVDLRILKSTEKQETPSDKIYKEPVNLPLERLDWAIAGTSSSTPKLDDDGKDTGISHGVWHHWINSRIKEVANLSDEGDNYPQEDGLTTLEKGTMVNPATGLNTDYEELWTDMDPVIGEPKGVYCAVLKFEGNGGPEEEEDVMAHRGMVMVLGDYCQGVLRLGDDVSVERWAYTGAERDGDWRLLAKMGGDEMPCKRVFEGLQELKEGDVVEDGKRTWTVVEVASGSDA